MSATIENQIRDLLIELGDATLVADEMVKRWERHLFSPSQQFELAQFLLKAGFYPTLLQQTARLLKQERAVPWCHLVEAFNATRFSLNDKQKEAIAKGCDEEEAWNELLISRQTDDWGGIFAKKRKARIELDKSERQRQKADLLDKLEFMRSQRLFQEEARVLDTLCLMFPQDADLIRKRQSYQQRWARDVISRHTSVLDASNQWIKRLDELTPETESARDAIVARAHELTDEDPTRALDLAMLLCFMEFYDHALAVLQKAPKTIEKNWLRLELLLMAHKYLDALEECTVLEVEFAADPDASFGLAYVRAQAMWGLGQKNLATDLMRGIVKVRPSYRSAYSLLLEWTGGAL